MASPSPDPKVMERTKWRCTKCSTRARTILIASMDPRWMLGYCAACDKERSIFEKAHD